MTTFIYKLWYSILDITKWVKKLGRSNFKYVPIRKDIYETVQKIVDKTPYRNVADFVNESIRIRIFQIQKILEQGDTFNGQG